jgi:hypothetical protein
MLLIQGEKFLISETIEDPLDTAEFARAKIESLLAQHQPQGE